MKDLVRIEIDPNVRNAGNLTYVRSSRVPGSIEVGDDVLCFESEEEVEWDGKIAEIANGFVYIWVDWESGRSAPGYVEECDVCGEDLSGGSSHYHCDKCGQVVGVMGDNCSSAR